VLLLRNYAKEHDNLIIYDVLKYSKPSLIWIDCGGSSALMKQKVFSKDKKNLEKIQMENLIIQAVLMKINTEISLKQFLPLSEAEIQGLLHPTQANLEYFLAWFQAFQVPSTQSGSLALIPLVL
jgi:hypothetical protein